MSERPAARAELLIENERLRVTRYSFQPGAATGFHRHALDYVIVPITAGRLALSDAAGKTSEAELAPGEPYARLAGVEHDVVNAGEAPLVFLEIELK